MDSFTESNPNPDSDMANRIRSKRVEKRKSKKKMTIHQKVPIPLVNRGASVKRGFSGYPNAIHNPNGI